MLRNSLFFNGYDDGFGVPPPLLTRLVIIIASRFFHGLMASKCNRTDITPYDDCAAHAPLLIRKQETECRDVALSAE
jgi:hypothetical protein